MTEHSFLPLRKGGILAARAALRLAASLLAALSAGAVVFAAGAHSSDEILDCADSAQATLHLLAALAAAWALLALEGLAQYLLRWRRLAESRVTSFSHGEVLEAMEDIVSNDAMGLWPSIQEGVEYDVDEGA